ncbi:MAG: hypothetical protein IIZ27_10315 [Solobacterium sp.]|nr:hypothetical protein [Solobacterium sp.]MBR2669508.1 hypothetical protein [Solobacterium sp.]
MRVVIAILILGSLFGLNVWLLKLNNRTPVPEGCENLAPECSACGITTCALRKKENKGETEND